MNDTVSTVEVIDVAIGLIRRRGWTQGRSVDDEGRVCLLQALTMGAHYNGPAYDDAQRIVKNVIVDRQRDRGRMSLRSIVAFNDDEETTVDDVLAVLDRAKIIAGTD